MSKSNPPEIQAPTTRGSIQLVMQGKGGVGKSLVSTWLAEYLLSADDLRIGDQWSNRLAAAPAADEQLR